MIYRLIFLLLSISYSLKGQTSHLLPAEILSKQALLDSLGFQAKNLSGQLLACGQFNQQSAATLISDRGLVLLSRSAILPYLPETVDPQNGFWATSPEEELALKRVFITFQMKGKNVRKEMLQGVSAEALGKEKSAKIARNRAQLMMQNQAEPGQMIDIRALNQMQDYYLYQFATYTAIHLVSLPPDQDQQAFALVRIKQPTKHPIPYPLEFSAQTINKQGIKAAIIDYPSSSKFNSSSYELALNQLSNEITNDLDTRLLQVYQKSGWSAPKKIIERSQQKKAINAYFQASNRLAKKQTLENSLLLDPDCQKSLAQLKNNFPALEEHHTIKTYGQEAFERVKLYQLARFLTKNTAGAEYKGQRNTRKDYLESWSKDWNATLDQQGFAIMAEAYFSRTKAQYLSPFIIDQIKVTGKSYTALADLLYPSSILTRPEELKKLLSQDLNTIQQTLNQDLAFRFLSQLSQDIDQKLMPTYRKQYELFQVHSQQYAQCKNAFLQDQWINESNGTQRIHFTNLSLSNESTLLTKIPGLPNTDMTPVLNMEGQLIGFRPEDRQLSAAYSWDWNPTFPATHRIISSTSILNYLGNKPKATYLLLEIKKAP